MESSSNAPEMQPWEDYFPRLTIEPRAGQQEAWHHAASDDRGDRLIVLPTGYGKTATGLGYYGVRRGRGLANRLLWVVSSDEQRRQLAPEPDKYGRRPTTASDQLRTRFGLDCLDTTRADGLPRELRMHWEDRAEVFVTTYQTILCNVPFFQQLLDTGAWLVIADEAHHLSEDGKWAEKLAEFPTVVETVYMSATPVRTDCRPLRGVPMKGDDYFAEPEVTWRDAIDEHAIRQPVGYEEDWDLKFEKRPGESVTVTTAELRDEKVCTEKDLDEFMVRHDLRRFTLGYLDKIYRDALARLDEKRARWPGRHQMIVFAMSNAHAKFLANEVFDDADWMGVQRSASENRAVMDRYKSGELKVLVQVDKAGEGFDHPPASVALFLNLIKSEIKLMQQLGRVLRRDEDIPAEYDYADVFADSEHQIIDVVRKLEPDRKELRDGPRDPRGPRGPGEWEPLPDLLEIEAQWRSTQRVTPDGMEYQHDPKVYETADAFGLTPEQIIAIDQMMHGPKDGRQEALPRSDNEVQSLEFYRDRVDRAMNKIINGAMRLIGLEEAVPKSLAGQLKRRLNGRWKRASQRGHDEMLADDFKAKYEWLQGIDKIIGEQREVPGWLRHGW